MPNNPHTKKLASFVSDTNWKHFNAAVGVSLVESACSHVEEASGALWRLTEGPSDNIRQDTALRERLAVIVAQLDAVMEELQAAVIAGEECREKYEEQEGSGDTSTEASQ